MPHAEEFTFRTTVRQTGNNTGIPVPDDVIAKLGAGRRPLVVVGLRGHTYRSAVGSMGGTAMIPLSAEHRVAAGAQDRQVRREADGRVGRVSAPQATGERAGTIPNRRG